MSKMERKEESCEENSTDEQILLREDDPERDLGRTKNYHSVLYLIIAIATLLDFCFDPNRLNFLLGLVPACFLMYSALEKTKESELLRQRQEKGRIPEERMVAAIQEAFKDAQVYHRVQIGERHDLDIFVRFPDKTMFAISVKNWGKGKVVFHEQRNLLCLRQANRSLRYLDAPDPLAELIEHELWLRKNNRAVFGGSSRDSRRPVKKVLAFAPPTIIQDHRAELYAMIGDQQFVCVERGKSSIFVISEDKLIDFISVNVASYSGVSESDNTSTNTVLAE